MVISNDFQIELIICADLRNCWQTEIFNGIDTNNDHGINTEF